MIEQQSDPGQPPKGQDSIDRRAWLRDRQGLVTGIAAAVLGVVVFKTLTVEMVQTHGFVSEDLTEGKIAVICRRWTSRPGRAH